MQMTQPVPAEVFYTDYATPSAWKSEPHLERLVDELERVLPASARIIDVGCNDGKFLHALREAGWSHLTGVEPTANTAAAAQNLGLDVRHMFLDHGAATSLVDEAGGPWDGVILRSVLEHIEGLAEFGSALNSLVRMGGLIAVEVPDSRLNLDHYDYSLWEEHVNYFTEETLGRFLTGWGFRPLLCYRSVFSGVMLTMLAEKVNPASGDRTAPRWEADGTAAELAAQSTWARSFNDFRSRVRDDVATMAARGEVCLYGVGNRSSLFLNLVGVADLVCAAYDDQPGKQNRFLPGSGIPILPGDELGRDGLPALVLLGVNAENEEAVLSARPILAATATYSVLPPSPRLLPSWYRRTESHPTA